MLDLETWCDISGFQNYRSGSGVPRKIDFHCMRDAGAVGVVIRKTLGKGFDLHFEENWQGAGDAGLKRSVYNVPCVAYDMGPQQVAMTKWPSGGLWDGLCDIPAWDDVERKHQLPLQTAITRLLPYHYAMIDTFGAAEIYTAKHVWQNFYSKKGGWGKDHGLVVASYRPDLYHLSIGNLKSLVAQQRFHPNLPIGWATDAAGGLIPMSLAWEQWQISADGNGLGPTYGVHSAAIDISFRQGKIPGQDSDPMAQLRMAFGTLVDAHDRESEILAEFGSRLTV